MANPIKKNSAEKNTPQKRKKGKTTKQLMDIHLKDKNHTITDEDIRNLDLKLGHPDTAPMPPEAIIPSADDRSEEEKLPKDEDLGKKKINTWDVLGG